MRAIILAAGRGSRMQQYTATKPKCMTHFMGAPLLEHQINTLRKASIDKIAIVVGYLDTLIRDFLKEDKSIHFFKNNEWEKTNMVSSLLTAKSWLSESPCIVSYSDIFYNTEPVLKLVNTKDAIAISYDPQWESLWRLRFDDPLSDAETFVLDSNNYLKEIGQRPTNIQQIQGQYMGLLKFLPDGWSHVEAHLNCLSPEKIKQLDMTSLLQDLVKNGTPIKAIPIISRWLEIDNPNDFSLYEEIFTKMTLNDFFETGKPYVEK